MEAWRKQLYANSLWHHGIKGQEWGKKNGPPYPLDEDDHSAKEEKMNWKQSISDFVSKYGSGKASDDGEAEYKDDLDTKYEQATWHGKVDSRLNKVASNFNTSKEDLVNEYVKTSDSKKFLNLLSKSGVISDAEKERLSKDENKAELESMRKAIVDQYDEKERRAQEKAASKGSDGKGSGGSGKGKSGGSGGKKASAKESKDANKASEKKSEETGITTKWQKPLQSYLTREMKANGWTASDTITKLIEYGEGKEGRSSYKKFLDFLEESNIFTEKELDLLSKDDGELGKIRNAVRSYLKKLAGQSKLQHSGVSALDGAPGRGSGRYALGSGEEPYQDYPNMRKKRTLGQKIQDARENSVYYQAKHMSNSELNDAVSRLRAEQDYISLSTSKITDGSAFVEGLLVKFGTRTVNKFVEDMADQTGLAASKKLFRTLKDAKLLSGASKRAENNGGEPKSDKGDKGGDTKPKPPKPDPPKPDSPKSTQSKKEKEADEEAAFNKMNKDLQDSVDKEHRKLFNDTIESTPSQADVAKKVKTAVENEIKKSETNSSSSTNLSLQKTVDDYGKEAERLSKEARSAENKPAPKSETSKSAHSNPEHKAETPKPDPETGKIIVRENDDDWAFSGGPDQMKDPVGYAKWWSEKFVGEAKRQVEHKKALREAEEIKKAAVEEANRIKDEYEKSLGNKKK